MLLKKESIRLEKTWFLKIAVLIEFPEESGKLQ